MAAAASAPAVNTNHADSGVDAGTATAIPHPAATPPHGRREVRPPGSPAAPRFPEKHPERPRDEAEEECLHRDAVALHQLRERHHAGEEHRRERNPDDEGKQEPGVDAAGRARQVEPQRPAREREVEAADRGHQPLVDPEHDGDRRAAHPRHEVGGSDEEAAPDRRDEGAGAAGHVPALRRGAGGGFPPRDRARPAGTRPAADRPNAASPERTTAAISRRRGARCRRGTPRGSRRARGGRSRR